MIFAAFVLACDKWPRQMFVVLVLFIRNLTMSCGLEVRLSFSSTPARPGLRYGRCIACAYDILACLSRTHFQRNSTDRSELPLTSPPGSVPSVWAP